MITNGQGRTIVGVGKYESNDKTKSLFNVWNSFGAYKDVSDIKNLAKIAKILDEVAAEKHYKKVAKEVEINTEKSEVAKAVDDLLNTFSA